MRYEKLRNCCFDCYHHKTGGIINTSKIIHHEDGKDYIIVVKRVTRKNPLSGDLEVTDDVVKVKLYLN